jgi:hypothetical protein
VKDSRELQATAAQSAIPGLESALGKPRSELSANEKSKVDLFTVLYGYFDTQDLGELYIAKQKLDNITSELVTKSVEQKC